MKKPHVWDYPPPKLEYQTFPSGNKYWRLPNGTIHRVGGPAIEYTTGARVWCINGEYHREDGPAIENSDGTVEWWYRNKRIDVDNLKDFQRYIRNKAFW
jgi:hypothetical protein